MGHRSRHAPHRGSLGYRPRKRASEPVPRVRTWVLPGNGGLAGLPAYKVAMGHVVFTETRKASPNLGREVGEAYTLLEIPPMKAVAVRLYLAGKAVGETWAELDQQTRDLLKRRTSSGRGVPPEQLKDIEADQVRVILVTDPAKTGLSKKRPDVLEVPVDIHDPKKAVDYGLSLLGKDLNYGQDVFQNFKPGSAVDVISISRGKGFGGPVARFGLKLLPHKSRKTKRGPGATGPQRPGVVPSTVARGGQMGYHHRVDHNKKVFFSTPAAELKIPGGLKHYGLPRSTLLAISGSVPGTPKRLVLLRVSVKGKPIEPPSIAYTSVS